MNVLVLGSGGREHALAVRLGSDSSVDRLWCAPGNPGIATEQRLPDLAPTDLDAVVAACRRLRIDLVVPGPEAPLAAGVADRLATEGIACFGPTRAAARLETSKVFAKAFMQRHGIPTARHRACRSLAEARQALDDFGVPVVVKADGLAAGKGVVVAESAEAAQLAVEAALVGGAFGDAGRALVIEEFLPGTEASFFAVCDGVHAMAAGTAQDHKRAFDDDQGPNTGGMGAFAPSPLLDEDMQRRVLRDIVEPTLAGMRAEGCPFVGFLYVGLMLGPEGPKVVEFNVRFGDPEAQVVLPLLEGDLAAVLARAAVGELSGCVGALTFSPDRTVGVVMASGGYPGAFERGLVIEGLDAAAAAPGVQVLHAGTAQRDGLLVTDGGRVLAVVGRDATYQGARARAYAAVDRIRFTGAHLRRDIGRRALEFDPPAR